MASIGKVQACAFFREYQDSQGTWQSEVHEFRAVSQDSEFSHEMGSVEGTDGAPYYSGDETKLNLMVFDNFGGAEIMKDAYRNREKYQFVLIGYDDHIFIYDELPVQVRKHRSFAPREFNYYEFSMSKSGGFHGVSSGKNILTAANEAQNKLARGWYDADADGLPDGFSSIGGNNGYFKRSSLLQNIDATVTSGSIMTYYRFPLPLSGVQLTLSNVITNTNGGDSFNNLIHAEDYDRTFLAGNTQAFTSTGTVVCEIDTPPQTHEIKISLLYANSATVGAT